MKVFLFIVVILTSYFSQAETYKDQWNRTAYDVDSLFRERKFNSVSCSKNRKEFVACVMGLSFLANNMPKVLQFKIDVDSTLVLKDFDGTPVTFKEAKAFKKNLKTLYDQQAPVDLRPHFERLYLLAKKIKVDIGYITTQAYSAYLGEAYDPHSSLITPEMLIPKPNKYFGIGTQIFKSPQKEGDTAKRAPLFSIPMPGSPAVKAGIKKGDLIYKVDGHETLTESVTEAVNRIKGDLGTSVALTIKRFCTGEMEDVTVVRGPISYLPNIAEESYFIGLDEVDADPKVSECQKQDKVLVGRPQALYIPLKGFSKVSEGPSLCDRFKGLLQKEKDNPDSLGTILDLRGNLGGDVEQTLCMLNSIIESEALIFQYNKVKKGILVGGTSQEFFNTDPGLPDGTHYRKPIIVLINSGSASASEIFAGTIQDMKRGWVVGDLSYGKGSVQTIFAHSFKAKALGEDFPKVDVYIKRTTAIYSLHSGRSPQRAGIIPDFRYSIDGKPIVRSAEESLAISNEMNIITGFKNKPWVQERPEEAANILNCVQSEGSLSQSLVAKIKNGEAPKDLHNFTNYQNLMARDILTCIQN